MAYGVLDAIYQREDFQQESFLARTPPEILGNCLDEFLAPRAHGLQQGPQSADSPRRIGWLMRKRRAAASIAEDGVWRAGCYPPAGRLPAGEFPGAHAPRNPRKLPGRIPRAARARPSARPAERGFAAAR